MSSQTFGCTSPYAEPLWYSRNKSPYYNESHKKLRAAVRRYVDEELIPNAFEWEQAGKVPEEVGRISPINRVTLLMDLGLQASC
jgi:hypothetical protein